MWGAITLVVVAAVCFWIVYDMPLAEPSRNTSQAAKTDKDSGNLLDER